MTNDEPKVKSERHLRFIRSLPCVVCRTPNSRAHHLLSAGERGTGLKAGDDKTIPLCPAHHSQVHISGSEGYLADEWGIDPQKLAKALWGSSGDRRAALLEYWRL